VDKYIRMGGGGEEEETGGTLSLPIKGQGWET